MCGPYFKIDSKCDSKTVETSWSNQAGESFEALGQPINYWHLDVDCGRWSVPWSNCENRNGAVCHYWSLNATKGVSTRYFLNPHKEECPARRHCQKTVPTYWFRVSNCSPTRYPEQEQRFTPEMLFIRIDFVLGSPSVTLPQSQRNNVWSTLHLSNFYLKHHNSYLCCPFRYSLVTMF